MAAEARDEQSSRRDGRAADSELAGRTLAAEVYLPNLPAAAAATTVRESQSEFPQLRQNSLVRTENDANDGVSGFFRGMLEGAVYRPEEAIAQIVNPESRGASVKLTPASGKDNNSDYLNSNSPSRQTGQIIGSLLPFVALSLISRKLSTELFSRKTPGVLALLAEQGTTGFAMGALLSPTDFKSQQDGLLASRLKQGAELAATLSAISGTAQLLEKTVPVFSAGTLAGLTRKIGITALSGSAGGVVDAELRTGLKANSSDLLSASAGYAAFSTLAELGGVVARPLLQGKGNLTEKAASGSNLQTSTDSFRKAMETESSLAGILAADTNASIISSPAGWYDKLTQAIHKAPPEHTIVVSDQKWFDAGKQLLKSARRPDIKLVLAEPEAAAPGRQSGAVQTDSGMRGALADQEEPWKQRARLLDSIKQEVQAYGEDPAEAITAALRRGRLVMVGEYHVPDSPNRLLGAKIMPQLKQAGLTHLAIEHSSDYAGKIFGSDGKLKISDLPDLLKHSEFYDLLNSAQKEGIEVVPVDGSYNASRDLLFRNKHMAEQLTQLLGDPESKVLYWVGNKHLHMIDAEGDGAQVAQLLRERKIPVSTFYGQHDNFWREEPLRNLYTPDRPVAVPTASAATLSKQNWLHAEQPGHAQHSFSEFDYVLMYPKQRAAHFD